MILFAEFLRFEEKSQEFNLKQNLIDLQDFELKNPHKNKTQSISREPFQKVPFWNDTCFLLSFSDVTEKKPTSTDPWASPRIVDMFSCEMLLGMELFQSRALPVILGP